MKHPSDILIQPIISEKTVMMQGESKYVFKVHSHANRNEIKKAVENKFNVNVVKINTIKVPAKPKKLGRYEGLKSPWKKAVVTLTPGETIKGFEGA